MYANEMSIREAATVCGCSARRPTSLLHRPGDHHGYNSITNYFDWLDEGLARLHVDPDAPPVAPMVYLAAGFDWSAGSGALQRVDRRRAAGGAPLATRRVAARYDGAAAARRRRHPRLLQRGGGAGTFARVLLSHEGAPINGSKAHANISSVPFSFGAYVSADAYFDRGDRARGVAGGGLPPVVFWLHGYGYNRGYDTQGNNTGAFLDLAAAGFVVIAYDQIGFGIRSPRAAPPSRRYPRGASLLGKMGRRLGARRRSPASDRAAAPTAAVSGRDRTRARRARRRCRARRRGPRRGSRWAELSRCTPARSTRA